MERLKKLSQKKKEGVNKTFKRFLFHHIDWSAPLNVITGHRGAGKTTLLLQGMEKFGSKAIYLSLDDIYFEANRLIHLIDDLYEDGYRGFFLDEVHRYRFWSKDLKNAYDNYADIRIFATGSSLLELSKGQADLSRRAVVHHLPGLSFREFINLRFDRTIPSFSLETILNEHQELSADIRDKVPIEQAFQNYLRYGYYPFFIEGKESYDQKLKATTHLVLDIDIPEAGDLTHTTLRNMKKLLYIISHSVPFKPNITKIADKMGISRNSVLRMLDLLDKARIIFLLRNETKGVSYLQKPEKIYLQNPNLLWILAEGPPEKGNLRETFFLDQFEAYHTITYSKWADLMVDHAFTFEVGGPNKTDEQIRGLPHAYIAADGIEGGAGNRIPLWLFGFLF